MRILLVEDDPDLGPGIARALHDENFAVDIAADGIDAAHLGETEHYDAAVLDLGLPGLDGVSVLRGWRAAKRDLPVLILTARDGWSDKVAGFKAGAYDYLVKPFRIEELVMRLRALVRRAAGHAQPQLDCGPLSFDTQTGQFELDGLPLRLWLGTVLRGRAPRGDRLSRERLSRRRLLARRPRAAERLRAEGRHYESRFHLTLILLPPADSSDAAGRSLVDRPESEAGRNWRAVLQGFVAETDRALDLLAAIMPEVLALTSAETLTYCSRPRASPTSPTAQSRPPSSRAARSASCSPMIARSSRRAGQPMRGLASTTARSS